DAGLHAQLVFSAESVERHQRAVGAGLAQLAARERRPLTAGRVSAHTELYRGLAAGQALRRAGCVDLGDVTGLLVIAGDDVVAEQPDVGRQITGLHQGVRLPGEGVAGDVDVVDVVELDALVGAEGGEVVVGDQPVLGDAGAAPAAVLRVRPLRHDRLVDVSGVGVARRGDVVALDDDVRAGVLARGGPGLDAVGVRVAGVAVDQVLDPVVQDLGAVAEEGDPV